MAAQDCALDRAGESGVGPVSGEVETLQRCLGSGTRWLSRAERERRMFLAHDRRADDFRVPRTGEARSQLPGSEIDQSPGIECDELRRSAGYDGEMRR